LSRNLINHITSLNEEQLKKMKKELQGEIDRSEKYEKDFKGSNREFALKKELDLVNYRLEDEMAMGGYMAKGGSVDNWVLYDNDTDEIISFHKSAKSAKSAANKILDAPIPKHKEVGFMLESNWNKEKEAIKKAQELRKHNKMAMGGVTFKDKVRAVKSSLLKRKKVSPSVQKDYGKTYSKKEAQESAERIVGAMTAKERLMKSMKKGKK
jgi:hypothetical protein